MEHFNDGIEKLARREVARLALRNIRLRWKLYVYVESTMMMDTNRLIYCTDGDQNRVAHTIRKIIGTNISHLHNIIEASRVGNFNEILLLLTYRRVFFTKFYIKDKICSSARRVVVQCHCHTRRRCGPCTTSGPNGRFSATGTGNSAAAAAWLEVCRRDLLHTQQSSERSFIILLKCIICMAKSSTSPPLSLGRRLVDKTMTTTSSRVDVPK